MCIMWSFTTCTFTNYLLGYQVTEDEMDVAYNIHGGDGKSI
jgi:hypothetical protein